MAAQRLDDSPALAPVIPLRPRTFREQTRYPWADLRDAAVAMRPILAPAIDRVGDWIAPSDVVLSPALVVGLAVLYLAHAPVAALRGAQ